MAKRVMNSTCDVWKGIKQAGYDRIAIHQKGANIKYLLPDGINLAYRAGSSEDDPKNPKFQAFQAVASDARKWIEKRPELMFQEKRWPITGKNDERLLSRPIHRRGYYADIVGAYWNTARHLGIISDTTYLKFHKDKFIRNAAIGALASKTNIWEWTPEKGKEFIETIHPETESAYWAISSFVGYRISTALPESLFFWVDCVYATDAKALKVLRDAFPPNFQYTEKTFQRLRYEKETETIFTRFPEKPKEKPYHFEKMKSFAFFETE